MRRLVRAKDDPAKQRIRAHLSEIDDARLFGLGLTSEDIDALRGTASPPAEAIIASQISPSIAGFVGVPGCGLLFPDVHQTLDEEISPSPNTFATT